MDTFTPSRMAMQGNDTRHADSAAEVLFAGPGDVRALCRVADWSTTPLGPVEAWPVSLADAVRLILPVPFAMVVLWGPELVQVYNDAYGALMGIKHPAGLGQPTRECWPEVWHINAPIYERVWGGETLSFENALYPLTRSGEREDAWLTLSYSPIRDGAGAVRGILVTVFETTAQQRAEAAVRERTADLHRSYDLLQATMDASMDMIQVFEAIRDEHGEIVDFRWMLNNHASERRYGRMAGASLLQSNPGVVEEGIFDALRRVTETGAAYQAEQRYAHEQFDGWFLRSVVKLGDGVAMTTKDITDWKLAQEEVLRLRDEVARTRLRESEEEYRALFNVMEQGFCIIEAIRTPNQEIDDFRYVTANPAFERHTGMRDVVGKTIRELVPDAESRIMQVYADVVQSGEPRWLEDHVAALDLWMEASVFPTSRPGQIAVLFSNVSLRKRAERVLRESEERQAFLLTLSDALGPLSDPVAIMSVASETLGRHLGVGRCGYGEVDATGDFFIVARDWTNGEMPTFRGRHRLAEFGAEFTADCRAGRSVLIEDALADARAAGAEAAFEAAGGVRSSLGVPMIKDGRFVAGLFVQDVRPRRWSAEDEALAREVAERTWAALERARVEAALRENQERLETALTTARMAYWDWDAATDTMVASRSMAYVFGVRDGEEIDSSETGFSIVHPEDRARHRAIVKGAGARGEGWHTEFRIIRPRDGEIAWLEERTTVTRDPTTGTSHTTGLVWDITDRKNADAAAALARGARERDTLRRELAMAEEEERRRLARELHDRLGQHLTAMTLGLDEVRGLLNGRDASGRDRLALRLGMRVTALQDLAVAMVRDAHDIAVELHPSELDDVGLASALSTYVAQWSSRYGVIADVEVSALPDEDGVRLSATTLYRVAQEALTNVARHASAAHVGVIVDEVDGAIRLIVEDDGVGFDVGTTLVRARAQRRLGLAGIRERAALVDGTVTIESSPGQGTTLYVSIPCNDREELGVSGQTDATAEA